MIADTCKWFAAMRILSAAASAVALAKYSRHIDYGTINKMGEIGADSVVCGDMNWVSNASMQTATKDDERNYDIENGEGKRFARRPPPPGGRVAGHSSQGQEEAQGPVPGARQAEREDDPRPTPSVDADRRSKTTSKASAQGYRGGSANAKSASATTRCASRTCSSGSSTSPSMCIELEAHMLELTLGQREMPKLVEARIAQVRCGERRR